MVEKDNLESVIIRKCGHKLRPNHGITFFSMFDRLTPHLWGFFGDTQSTAQTKRFYAMEIVSHTILLCKETFF